DREGEAGVGKLALARAVHQRRNPAAPCHVLDATDAAHDHEWLTRVRTELAEGTGLLVLRRIHALSARQARALTSALAAASADAGPGPVVAVTLDSDATRTDLSA